MEKMKTGNQYRNQNQKKKKFKKQIEMFFQFPALNNVEGQV